MRRALIAGVMAVVGLTGACTAPPPAPPDPHTGGVNPDEAPAAGEARYATAGPYAAGVLTVEIQPGRRMEVWYPAPPEAAEGATPDTYFIRDFLAPELQGLLSPTANPPFTTDAYRGLRVAPDGPYPLVLFSHGFMSYRLQSTSLTTHLASWGFVVISPDYFERGLRGLGSVPPAAPRSADQVVELALAAVEDLNETGPLAGAIDTSRLFPVGHSAGGSQSTSMAGTRTDVQSWISMSSGINLTPSLFNLDPKVPPALSNPEKDVLWITGRNDNIARLDGVLTAYRYTAGEKKLVVIPGAGHNNAMADICEIGRAQGGLIALAESGGLPLPDFVKQLARDGCVSPPNLLGPEVWPVVRHFVTAELRYRSGLDPQPVGLGTEVTSQFGSVVPTYEHAE
jgi:dienelactone hydrolase